jgi:DNA-binding NarL/FixJ family response regulator
MTRVLIVEDHASLRAMLAELIERTEGLELCGQSGSAEAALDRLEEARPELALIDVSLPGMNGIELVEALLRRRPATLCVMLSGHRSRSYAEAARTAGAKAYVHKTEAHELVKILGSVFGGASHFPSNGGMR